MSKTKLVYLLIFNIILSILTFSGCSSIVQKEENQEEEKKQQNKQKITNQDREEEFSLESIFQVIPKPDTPYIVDFSQGIYFRSMRKIQMKEYIKQLEDQDWSVIDQSQAGTDFEDYVYEKESYVLQVELLYSKGDIIVRLDKDFEIPVKQSENALSKMEALELVIPFVQEKRDRNELISTNGKVRGVIEIYLKDAFEKIGMQAFAVIGEDGLITTVLNVNNGRTVLDAKNSMCLAFGTLENSCVFDIDGDGSYELVDLYSNGEFGNRRIDLNIYEYDTPIYFSSLTKVMYHKTQLSLVPKTGEGILRLIQTDDNKLNLCEYEWQKNGDQPYQLIQVKNYGELAQKNFSPNIDINKLKNFPYDLWDEVYNQDNWPKNSNTPLDLPKPIISIDGNEIVYLSSPLEWSGKKNKRLDFSDCVPEDLKSISANNSLMNTFKAIVTMNFGEFEPDKIEIKDYYLSNGKLMYNEKIGVASRYPKKEQDKGIFSFGIPRHMAAYFSSDMNTYIKPQTRGFRITCYWGENIGEYVFIITSSTS